MTLVPSPRSQRSRRQLIGRASVLGRTSVDKVSRATGSVTRQRLHRIRALSAIGQHDPGPAHEKQEELVNRRNALPRNGSDRFPIPAHHCAEVHAERLAPQLKLDHIESPLAALALADPRLRLPQSPRERGLRDRAFLPRLDQRREQGGIPS
jgi:hypothetical protein